MIQIQKAAARGHFNHGWLNAYHTFSFGDFYDPEHTHFRALRVMNEDRIEPGINASGKLAGLHVSTTTHRCIYWHRTVVVPV